MNFLQSVYEWLYRGKPMDTEYLVFLLAPVVFGLVLVVSALAATRYRRGLEHWKRAGGTLPRPDSPPPVDPDEVPKFQLEDVEHPQWGRRRRVTHRGGAHRRVSRSSSKY